MAEERLIDEDKDRKYRIRLNENGDEEMVAIDDTDVDAEPDIPFYEIVSDEENDGLTVDEVLARKRQRQEDMRARAEALKDEGREKLAMGDYEGALTALEEASRNTEYDGELYFMLLKARTRDMTEFSSLSECAEASEGVREYSTPEQKGELREKTAKLEEYIAEVEKKREALSKENESGKAERRTLFVGKFRRATVIFAIAAVLFAALAVTAIVCASMLYADKEGLFIILTAVFGGGAAVALIVTAFTLHSFLNARRKVKLNESDSSTAVGRRFLECDGEYSYLRKIYSDINDDIS